MLHVLNQLDWAIDHRERYRELGMYSLRHLETLVKWKGRLFRPFSRATTPHQGNGSQTDSIWTSLSATSTHLGIYEASKDPIKGPVIIGSRVDSDSSPGSGYSGLNTLKSRFKRQFPSFSLCIDLWPSIIDVNWNVNAIKADILVLLMIAIINRPLNSVPWIIYIYIFYYTMIIFLATWSTIYVSYLQQKMLI